MTHLHDRSIGDRPWSIVAPALAHPKGVPPDAHWEDGFFWWVEGGAPDLIVMRTRGDHHFESVRNSEYPNEIWDRMKALDPSLK